MVVDRLGMDLHTYRREVPQLDRLREWTRLFDGPVPVFPPADAERGYEVARDLGIRMVMNGAVAELVFDMRSHLLAHLVRHGRVSVRCCRRRGRGGHRRIRGATYRPTRA